MLSAHNLTIFEKCRRRYAFEKGWEPQQITSFMLLEKALREAVCSPEPEATAESVVMRTITQRELIYSKIVPTYLIAKATGALAGILATFLRFKLGILTPVPPFPFLSVGWESLLFKDSKGTLHRILLVDHWDDDRLTAEAHSWNTIGEMIANNSGFTLHILAIGQMRQGRRQGIWSKGLLHPITKHLRFKRRGAGSAVGVTKNWTTAFREEHPEISTLKWLQVMKDDLMFQDVYKTREIVFNPTDPRIQRARRDMVILIQRMERATEKAIMTRSACDSVIFGACPFQGVCWAKVHHSSPGVFEERFKARETPTGGDGGLGEGESE